MGELSTLFIDGASAAPFLQGQYNPWLVLLSLLVSIFSATMALQTAQIARGTESPLYRQIAVGTGAIALGGGIWSMHFIGMLAFELPAHVHYDTGITLLSMLPAGIASWFALRLLAGTGVAWPQLIMSGALVGLGIGTMHYSGMAAMQTPLQMRYEPLTFALSIVVAVALAILALWVRYGLRRVRLHDTAQLVAAGAVMGLAIAAMHYTGMAATRFTGEPGPAATTLLFNNVYASLALSTFTVTVTVLVYALNGLVRSRELYRQVEESQSRLRATLDTAVDGIITIDSRGIVQAFNHSAERLFGWRTDEVVGRNISMLMPEPDQSRHDGYLQKYLASGTTRSIGVAREVIGLRKNGSLMPMRLAVGRVELPGELLFVGFVTDISERHALEASLRETAARAERAAAAKSSFLANMSHEIRTPMNSIIGFTELLLQSDLTPKQRTHLNTIRQSSRSLLGLINDILDTTRLEKGGMTLERIDFSLKGVAMQIESSLRLGAQAKQLTLTTHYPDDMPEYFLGDPLRVLQILTNLVGNAIKFTERGGVDVIFSREQGLVHVQVRDTGIGMTAEQVETIFAPFTQADASVSRRFGGTGLGTTIARQLVELMDGDIDVDSAQGHGSTFHIRLPLPLGQKPSAPEHGPERLSLPPLRVLIADDVEQNIELLTLTLGDGGHQVTSARDGDEAVAQFMDGQFDIVLMDVHMPVTDGLQATRLIRQYERTHGLRSTPIIALTASVMAEDRRAAHQAGMDGFAVKPLDVPRLLDEISRVLGLDDKPAAAAVAATGPRQLIDWPTGIVRWGSEARLTKAMHQFFATVTASHPLPDDDEPDWERLRFSLHGIRGAAGNLALPAIAELAGSLEQQCRTGERDGLQPQLATLRQLLQETAHELAQTAPPPADGEADTATPTAAPGDWHPSLQRLQTLLARNELDDTLLEQVCAGLEQQGRRAQALTLRAAIEAFEFIEAQALLQRLAGEHSAGKQQERTP